MGCCLNMLLNDFYIVYKLKNEYSPLKRHLIVCKLDLLFPVTPWTIAS